MSRSKRNYRSTKSNNSGMAKFVIVAIVIALVVVAVVGALNKKPAEPKEQTFVAEAPMYKDDLSMFEYWADADGKNVSTKNPYSYKREKELELTPMYSNLDMQILVNTNGTSAFTQQSNTYVSKNWYDVAYINRPIQKGTTVEFTVATGDSVIFGISTKDRIEAHADYHWGTNFAIFCPEYNFYSSKSETSALTLTASNTSNMGGKTYYSTWENFAKNPHTFRFVFGDTVKIYVDDIEFSDPKFNTWQIDYSAGYYITLSGAGATYTLTKWDLTKNVQPAMTATHLAKTAYSGKKITFLGDSITVGAGSGDNFADKKYSTVLSTALGATENNMGISGTVLCTGHASRASRLNDVAKIPLDSEAVVIMLGTNDFDNATSGFATLGKMGDTDTTTIYGAMDKLCKLLLERFGNTETRIYVFTPIGRMNEDSAVKKCANGYTLRDLCKAYMEVCVKYKIPCFDLNAESGLVSSDYANTLHPNEAGSIKISNYMQSKLFGKWTY